MPFGGIEFLILVVVIALLFGSSRLPQLARSLRQAQAEYRSGVDGERR